MDSFSVDKYREKVNYYILDKTLHIAASGFLLLSLKKDLSQLIDISLCYIPNKQEILLRFHVGIMVFK